MRQVLVFACLLACAHCYPIREETPIVFAQEEQLQMEDDGTWNSNFTDWDDNAWNNTDWWADLGGGDNVTSDAIQSIPKNNTSSFYESFLELFATHNETSTGYIFITYIQMIPMIQCPEIDKVVQLFNSKIGEANPLAELSSMALEFAGLPCNATQCKCETDSRRKLAFKTLTVQTRSNVHILRPATHFPLNYDIVSTI